MTATFYRMDDNYYIVTCNEDMSAYAGGLAIGRHFDDSISECEAMLHRANTQPVLLEALEGLVKYCPTCDGKGVAYTIPDETEVGQPPGSSGIDCSSCTQARAAAAPEKGETP